MNRYLKIAGNIHLSYFIEAADILGIDYEIVVPQMTARFQYKDVHWFINNTVTPLTNAPSSRLSRSKDFANKLLKQEGIPVPEQEVISDIKHLNSFFEKYKRIVVKPRQNLGGKGITILPNNHKELKNAYKFAQKNDKKRIVLAEKYIEGTNYRLLTIGDKVIGVVKRLSARVIGDGHKNIQELIDEENQNRKLNELLPIPTDKECLNTLKEQGYKLNSIPIKDKVVLLRANTNLTTGGTTQECSKEVHKYYLDLAIKALKVLDLQYGGVDLIAKDITKPGDCAINEINYNPGLRLHYKINSGEAVKVAIPILEYIRDWKIKTKQ